MSKIILTSPTIVHVLSYYPPHLGGMENVAAQVAEGFAERGYRVSVYTSNRGYARNTVINSKPQVHYLKSIELAHTPIIFTLFFRLLALSRHSLIHLHVAQAFVPEIVYLVSKLRGIPYIAHIHLDVDPSGPLGFLLETYKKLFLRRVLKSAAKIICISEAQKKLIAAKYMLPRESIVVIPNGVAREYFTGKKTIDNRVPRLLFVGRLVAQKNVSMLIEAISQMQASVLLDVVGEGEQRKNIEALIQKYGLRNVKLHGIKTGQELIELYKSADIFVLLSLKEAGIPLAMLEAMAAGLPVVTSKTPEVAEDLDVSGILIEYPTAANCAKALDTLLLDKDTLHKLRTLAIKKARPYSWEKTFDSIEDIYKGISHDFR